MTYFARLSVVSVLLLVATFTAVLGDTQSEPPIFNLQEVSVTFENEAGKTVDLYWSPKHEATSKYEKQPDAFQATLKSGDSVRFNSFVNHNFKFVEHNEPEKVLLQIKVFKHIPKYTLYSENEMKQRKQQLFDEKRNFAAEYKKKTGRQWTNFYPRPKVQHFVHDITEIGQEIRVRSGHPHFVECPSDVTDEEVIAELDQKEANWKEANPGVEFQEPVCVEAVSVAADGSSEIVGKGNGTAVERQCQYVTDDIVANEKNLPPFFSVETETHVVYRWSDKLLCKPKMDGPEDYPEFVLEALCNEPRFVSITDFMSPIEAEHIVEIGKRNGMMRSTVSNEATVTRTRTSSTLWLKRSLSPVIDHVTRRIADLTGVDERVLYLNTSCEDLQLVHYSGGQLYQPHLDYGTTIPMNRFITFLMYLNDVPKGGNTSFPEASEQCMFDNNGKPYFGVHPTKGKAVFFYNLYADGNADPRSLHFAEPPAEGSEKWMTNMWIWDPYFPFH